MDWKKFFRIIFSSIFILFVVSLLVLYWFFPFRTTEFWIKTPSHANFSLNASELINMQFYEKMRYPDSKISYRIDNCTLQKQDNMEQAFDIIENKTILEFYSVNQNEEISVTCDSKARMQEGLFIAGEGGPTNITQTKNFNVILHGKVLLIRESGCERPNIAVHELLHALGFDHSNNPNNIMYNFSKCNQIIGDDIPQLINELYSYPSYSDLAFENASAIMNGRFLDLNVTIRNHGLKKAEEFNITIYADNKFIKELDSNELEIGVGRMIILTNLWISKINFKELKIFINSTFSELDKKNNKITLEIKK